MTRFIFIVLLFCAMSQENLHAQMKNLSPELLWQTGRVSLDAVSPDGKLAVYGVQTYDIQENKGSRKIYLLDIATGKSTVFVGTGTNASDVEFHPSGDRIGFLNDGKFSEIMLNKPAEVKTVMETEVNGFHYAPNGKFILFTQDVKFDKTVADMNPDLPKANARVIDGLFYRHWKSWHDYQYSNVFYTPYSNGAITGKSINIMNEAFDSPLAPTGGMEQITWSPDSRFIVYTCRKEHGTAEAQSTNSDLYLYEIASGKTLNFTQGNLGYDTDPVFSPDGHYVAWTSMERAGYEADRTRLMILDTYTQQKTELTEGWTYESNSPQWSADSKSIYFLSSENFTYQFYQVGLTDKKIRRITNGQHDYTALKVAGNKLIGTRTTMVDPAEIYSVDTKTGAETRLTFVTDNPWKDIARGKVERHTVKTVDGKNLNVWVILPANFDPKKRYPALLYCQGGPQSALSQGFSYRWNFQMMAANGYVIIAPCRRGMPGAGQAWNDEIMHDWGGKPMQDYLSATDYAAKLPYVNPDKIGAVGASFGGFSVYWLAGNHNKRFKAFISHCGLYNLESFYGTTEEVWFPKNDFGGAYWQSPKPEMYKSSPHLFAQNWDTPILVIHNELDYRVPLSEGMQAFQAAQLRGVPSKFLYFSDEGHQIGKPQNSILWQREFFKWLDTYLKN